MHSLDWTDLQYVLTCAEERSLSRTARKLGVNHTTVLRRIARCEAQLGTRLFERLATGYVLTTAGEELAAAARQVNDTVSEVERRLVGQDLRLSGQLRITTTDTLAQQVLPKVLVGFAEAHPQVQLSLTTTTALLNLSQRDADVAVRPSKRPPDNLLGRRVGPLAFAVYAAERYLAQVPARRALREHVWLGPDDGLAGTTVARWMAKELKGVVPRLRTDTLTALCDAARAGLGVAALPCYLGDAHAELRRVRAPIPEMSTELWVLTHVDLKGTARVRAVTDWLVEALGRERDLFEGRRPQR